MAKELGLKLGIRVSPRTVRKYMPKCPGSGPRGDQRWRTFVNTHVSYLGRGFVTPLPYSGRFVSKFQDRLITSPGAPLGSISVYSQLIF